MLPDNGALEESKRVEFGTITWIENSKRTKVGLPPLVNTGNFCNSQVLSYSHIH